MRFTRDTFRIYTYGQPTTSSDDEIIVARNVMREKRENPRARVSASGDLIPDLLLSRIVEQWNVTVSRRRRLRGLPSCIARKKKENRNAKKKNEQGTGCIVPRARTEEPFHGGSRRESRVSAFPTERLSTRRKRGENGRIRETGIRELREGLKTGALCRSYRSRAPSRSEGRRRAAKGRFTRAATLYLFSAAMHARRVRANTRFPHFDGFHPKFSAGASPLSLLARARPIYTIFWKSFIRFRLSPSLQSA